MEILISADLEGATGITQWRQVLPERDPREFERIRMNWMGDINAAIQGCLECNNNIHFLITEAHYEMTYIIPELLSPKAEFISGFFKKNMHLAGIDQSTDGVILFTHAMAGGSSSGILSHSLVTTIHNLYLNGVRIGELQLNAALAGWYGVPVIMVIGDLETSKEAKLLFGEDFPVAVTKTGLDRFAAKCLTPEKSQQIICATAKNAIEKIKERKPFLPKPPFELDIEFQGPTMATACTFNPKCAINRSKNN